MIHKRVNKHTACDLSSFVNGRHESSENDQYLYRREDCLTKLCDIVWYFIKVNQYWT